MKAEELKRSILQKAMEGKLIPQNSNDDSVDILLNKIKLEKERLLSKKFIKNEGDLPDISPEEIPFEIPDTWKWVRLGEIGISNIGLTYKPENVVEQGIPVLRSSNIQNDKIDYDNLIKVNVNVSQKLMAKPGDLLICARNGSEKLVGKTALIEVEGMSFGAFMSIFRSQCNEFVHKFFISPVLRNQLTKSRTTTINQITQKTLKNILIPLPPLEEQQRIVEKVDKLLEKVNQYDDLEKRLTTLNDSFPENMEKSVLQYAFEGKLSEKDSNHEPVEKLFNKINNDSRIKKKIESNKDLYDKHELELPESWGLCTLDNISIMIGSQKNKILKKEIVEDGTVPVITQGKKFIEGYTNQIEKKVSISNPVIMFGDHTRNVKFVEFNFVIGADGTKFFMPLYIEPKYLYYWTIYTASIILNRGYGRHFSLLKKESIPIPPIEEQKQIVQKIEGIYGIIKNMKSIIL